jgi:hypothetical protein
MDRAEVVFTPAVEREIASKFVFLSGDLDIGDYTQFGAQHFGGARWRLLH